MKPLTARIIGADGRMGREHVDAYTAAGVKIVDVGKTDIVSIASPDNTHAEYVLEALEQGSHVFCEKPLCTTAAALNAIKKNAKRRHVWQNYPLRYQPIFNEMAQNITSFGEIYRVEAAYEWGRTNKLSQSWRAEDPNYSLVLGGMIHMIDLVLYMLPETIDPVSVIGCNLSAPDYDGLDTITAQCRMSNGGVCTFTVDGGTGVKNHRHCLTLHGTKRGRKVVNHLPTDKQVAVRHFIQWIKDKEPVWQDFEAIETALEIERWA